MVNPDGIQVKKPDIASTGRRSIPSESATEMKPGQGSVRMIGFGRSTFAVEVLQRLLAY
jgi:hypothetical protein